MAIEKDFDCVRMKDDIQRVLLDRHGNKSEEEIREEFRRQLDASQSPIAIWWRQVCGRKRAQSH